MTSTGNYTIAIYGPSVLGRLYIHFRCLKFLLFSQAIAAMMRAQEADPTNLEVLLALGVSHTNGKL